MRSLRLAVVATKATNRARSRPSEPVALRLDVVDAQLNDDETQTADAVKAYDKKKEPDGEGSGSAVLYRKDPTFEDLHPDGVDDMVLMQQLNDAELANNLRVCAQHGLWWTLRRSEIWWWGFQVKFKKNLGYVRCGPTLVALNLMGNFTGTNSLCLCLSQWACVSLPVSVSLCLSHSQCSADGWWGVF